MMYPVIDASAWQIYRAEPMGTKAKDWRLSPNDEPWLLKMSRQNKLTGVYAGEDWSEKIAAELAALLQIPHAIVDLASANGEPGVLVKDFVGDRRFRKLTHGNELLAARVSAYPKEQKRGVSLHTIDAVFGALSENYIRLPEAWREDGSIESPVDTFVGYLMLDAIVGNTDRHHENWAIIEVQESTQGGPRIAELAPSFDHASCLGREMTDELRQHGLSGKKPTRSPIEFRKRCRSALYQTESDLSALRPIEAFRLAAKLRPLAARRWLQLLSQIDEMDVRNIIGSIPEARLSATGRQYTARLLELGLNEVAAVKV